MEMKDRWGAILKFPERSCKECSKFPCLADLSKCKCDFAKYGCLDYDKKEINKTKTI